MTNSGGAPSLFDWQFWSTVAAFTALVLSQLPPVKFWFRPRRLEVEVHNRLQVTHLVGNANLLLYVIIRNTGGRELQVRGINVSLLRDHVKLGDLQGVSYFEAPTHQTPLLLVPFSLKPGETWAHMTNFVKPYDRQKEKFFREIKQRLLTNIGEKLRARQEGDKAMVEADAEVVRPILDTFERDFIWEPAEYQIDLLVQTNPGAATFNRKYRFTLYESDSEQLRNLADDYKFGGGITFPAERHIGVSVPLAQEPS